MLKSCCSFREHRALDRRPVNAVHVELLRPAFESPCQPVTSRLESDVARLVNHAQRVLRAFVGEAFPRGLTRDRLVLSEILFHPQCFPVGYPGIHCHNGDSGGNCALHGRCHDRGLGERDGDPGDLSADCRAHELGLSRRVRVMGVPQVEVVLRGRGFGAAAYQIPERVAWRLMGDECDRRARLAGVGCTRRGRTSRPLARTCRDRNHQHREDVRKGHSGHRSAPPTRAAATTPRSGGHPAIIAGNRR